MIEQIDYPFQYPGYDTHPKDASIGHHRNPYITHNGTGIYFVYLFLFLFQMHEFIGHVRNPLKSETKIFNKLSISISRIPK